MLTICYLKKVWSYCCFKFDFSKLCQRIINDVLCLNIFLDVNNRIKAAFEDFFNT